MHFPAKSSPSHALSRQIFSISCTFPPNLLHLMHFPAKSSPSHSLSRQIFSISFTFPPNLLPLIHVQGRATRWMLENILTGDGAAATVVDTFAGASWALIAITRCCVCLWQPRQLPDTSVRWQEARSTCRHGAQQTTLKCR